MKFKGKDYQMCDAWFLNSNDRIHVFNLKLPGTAKEYSIGHSYTDDLLHFHSCPDVLEPLYSDDMPEDYLDKWTGCGYTAHDGTHYIYYTMRNKWESQKIGVAISNDLKNFELYYKNPVIIPDKNVFAYTGEDGIKEDCRDMIVVFQEKTKTYYGYFATMAQINDRLTGVIGVAESTDLLHWGKQSIAYVPPFDGIIEVPDVFFLDGKWYLTVLTHSSFGAKGDFSDSYVQSGTIYASSKTPQGPFVEGKDNVFIGGTHQSGFTCRTFMYKGKRYVMYIDKSDYRWAISLPKEVRVVDGNLRPCYSEILKKIRRNIILENLTAQKIVKTSSSIFWNVGNAMATTHENGVSIKTNNYSYQTFMIESKETAAAEIEFKAIFNCREGGIIIRTNNSNYSVTANTQENTLTVYKDSLNYNIFCKRTHNFEKGKEYHFRIILLEGQIEIYVDDVLVLQNAFKTEKDMTFGLLVGCGESIFKKFKVYSLEN